MGWVLLHDKQSHTSYREVQIVQIEPQQAHTGRPDRDSSPIERTSASSSKGGNAACNVA
jgi:hypothetical protein